MSTTAVKERPIIFSSPMVRAIIEGRKTMTRRVCNRDIRVAVLPSHRLNYPDECEGEERRLVEQTVLGFCRFRAGERAWVRETWLPRGAGTAAIYRADYSGPEAAGLAGMYSDRGWRPSIHMPRWASRITLEITDVRVERLQEISESDAWAEGAPLVDNPDYDDVDPCDDQPQTHLAGFIELWDELNAKRGFSWATNPFVWVLRFKRVTP